jgi:uncharacterized protein involved in type VI secretion and phage assembly
MNSELIQSLLATPSQSARFYGVTIGVVTNNQDPDNLGRVKVRFPWLSDESESTWARLLTPMAGKERGIYFLPEVDDEVLVAFEHGDMNFPYILGGLWNGKDLPPETNSDGKNNQRIIRSRSGHTIRLDDTEGKEKIEIEDSSQKNQIIIDTADNTITIKADADIIIQAGSGKLVLSGNGIELKSQANIAIEASQNMDLKAGPQLNIKGSMVNIN